MEVQVDIEDQTYAHHLERALQSQQRTRSGARPEEGFWALPIDEVLPAPEHIPESFRGKSWALIEKEDEEKVEKLVQQFRKDKFICYFDSESLARYTESSGCVWFQNKSILIHICWVQNKRKCFHQVWEEKPQKGERL